VGTYTIGIIVSDQPGE